MRAPSVLAGLLGASCVSVPAETFFVSGAAGGHLPFVAVRRHPFAALPLTVSLQDEVWTHSRPEIDRPEIDRPEIDPKTSKPKIAFVFDVLISLCAVLLVRLVHHALLTAYFHLVKPRLS